MEGVASFACGRRDWEREVRRRTLGFAHSIGYIVLLFRVVLMPSFRASPTIFLKLIV